MQSYWVYIATNPNDTVLYTGITNDIVRRMNEHASKIIKGFTAQYNVNKLIYCEEFPSPMEAIATEKRIKGWVRSKKIALIKTKNPQFLDLLRREEGPSGIPQDDTGRDNEGSDSG